MNIITILKVKKLHFLSAFYRIIEVKNITEKSPFNLLQINANITISSKIVSKIKHSFLGKKL